MNPLLPWWAAIAIATGFAIVLLPRAVHRFRLSRAKHPSLAGHPRIAKRLARTIPDYAFSAARFFRADGAPEDVAARRRRGFETLAEFFTRRSPTSAAALKRLASSVSDLRFTGRYRVPFPFSRLVSQHLASGVLLHESNGHEVVDVDGNSFIDLTGAYGVNVFGNPRYKRWIEQGVETVSALGPVLGPYHPVIEANVERLKQLSGLDEVSFHMSGTEAIMQAVRLARFHTGRSHLVRFAGAYHGWWDDVQPGIGNPTSPGNVYTLAEMSPHSLTVLRTRRDIACVLINPLQALHPNANAPGDGSLVTGIRSAGADRQAYAAWLQAVRQACNDAGIVLIIDEIFVGFRIARRGAQEYFDVRGDLVAYGKTLGGGLPVGVLCGRAGLMKRFREDRPADICFARGTFNSHPYVLGAMSAFLDWYETDEARSLYPALDSGWNARAQRMNEALAAAGLPISAANLSSIFLLCYSQPTRYAWMLQYYLNRQGLLLPWVGTGRFIFPIDFDEASFVEVIERFVAAGRAMERDGWWWQGQELDARAIRRQVLGESWRARLGRPVE
jgi:glutamate-1-semialdehyde 2,1-aminomutase